MDKTMRLTALMLLVSLVASPFGALAQTTSTQTSQSTQGTSSTSTTDDEGEEEALIEFSGEDPENGPTACGAVMCLWGLLQGQKGGPNCKKQSAGFFKIKVKHAGHFSPERTQIKRAKYLAEKCKATDTIPFQPPVVATFGPMKKSPSFQ